MAFGEILVGRVGFPSLICFSVVALVVGLTNFFDLKYWTFAANEQEPQRSV
jgi:hypothetical protein